MAPCTVAGPIVNGDFEDGTLSGWTAFRTTNGTVGSGIPAFPRVVLFDTAGSGTSLVAQFRVGQVVFEGSSSPRGGGIFQIITTSAGPLNFRANVSALGLCDQECANVDAGAFELQLDGAVLDRVDLGPIGNGEVLRGVLSGSVAVGAGSHDLRIQITRTHTEAGATQYVDDVAATAAPEAGSEVLLGVGGAALWLLRRRRLGVSAIAVNAPPATRAAGLS